MKKLFLLALMHCSLLIGMDDNLENTNDQLDRVNKSLTAIENHVSIIQNRFNVANKIMTILISSTAVALVAGFTAHTYNKHYCKTQDKKISVENMVLLAGSTTAIGVGIWLFWYCD